MERTTQQCPGDCSKCQLLAEGIVDMVPCALDQLMQRTRSQATQLAEIKAAIAAAPQPAALASITPEITTP